MRRIIKSVTTIADGSATVYSPKISGKIHSVTYLKTDFADGVDFTISAEESLQSIWAESNVNASTSRLPRVATHTSAGVAATLDGTVAALDKVALANDRIKIVIAQGGNVKTGHFLFLVD